MHNSKNLYTAIISSASGKKCVGKSTREKVSPSRNKITEISGVEGSWESLQMERISSNAAKLIPHSRRKSSATKYESAWGQWNRWCNNRQVNTFQVPVNYIINFLNDKFDKGLQYKTLSSLRSAVSVYHVHIDNKSVEKYLNVCALLACIFNPRPPQPIYVFIWDVEIIICSILLLTGMTIHPLLMKTKLFNSPSTCKI